MTDGIPAPIVTAVADQSWTTLEVNPTGVNMLKTLVTITATGSSQVPNSATTYTDIYVNAPGIVDLTLPPTANLAEGQEYLFVDSSNLAATNNIVIIPNTGQTINGSLNNAIINVNSGTMCLVWNGSDWVVKL